jgi:hypothetical protein
MAQNRASHEAPSKTSSASVRSTYKPDSSATRVDVALLASTLFLQRFSVPFGPTHLGLELVAMGSILTYQFISEKLVIQYDRLLWFLGLALATTSSLLLNFNSTMVNAYSQFTLFYALLTLKRPSTDDQYKNTLQGFQFLTVLLSCLAVVQFAAQVVGELDRLTNFYGIIPDVLLGEAQIDRTPPSEMTHFRANGIFLTEPSALSQITALGILIEVLEFHRPRYLLIMSVGFLLAYSGTGSILLLLFLPLAAVRHDKAGFPALLVIIFAAGLFATGIMDLGFFTGRAGEFQTTRTSGFSRFVSPLWLAAKKFDTESLQTLLLGAGPGTAKIITDTWYAGFVANWFKIFHEYGMFGSVIVCCFLASCFRRSRCPGVVVAAIYFAYLFLQGMLTIAIPLVTLSGREPRSSRPDQIALD